MKTFTATQLSKSAQEVFAAAKEDGTVLIEHDRYNGVFALVWNRQHSDDEVKQQIKGDKDGAPMDQYYDKETDTYIVPRPKDYPAPDR